MWVIIASPFFKGVSVPMYAGLCVSWLNLMTSVFGLFLSISIFVFPHWYCLQRLSSFWIVIYSSIAKMIAIIVAMIKVAITKFCIISNIVYFTVLIVDRC